MKNCSERLGDLINITWAGDVHPPTTTSVLYTSNYDFQAIEWGIVRNWHTDVMLVRNHLYVSQHIRFKEGSNVWEGLV